MTFKKNSIPFAASKQFSQLFLDYISGDTKLRSFYSHVPHIDSFKQVIEEMSSENINRKLLVDVLTDQYSNFKKSDLHFNNIQLLLNKNTFTVTTGHQLCVFTGPLYFIYKILSTINLAEELKKNYPEQNFVPVYWMASEDHDFVEISSIHLFGKTVSWKNAAKGAVGRLNTDTMDIVIYELSQLLGESENAKSLIQLFRDSYLNQQTLSEATRYLVHQLFSDYGLIILDADDARLKDSLSDIIKDDIVNNTNFKIVNKTIADLEKIGHKAQVNPREINFFKLTDTDRVRIEKATPETLSYASGDYSPNVVLRPLYQQLILPNLAYVGGPGEIAYWLEYKAMFDHHKIIFPVLIPRNFAILSDEKTGQHMQKLGLTSEAIFEDTEQLIKDFVNKNSDISLSDQEQKIRSTYNELSIKASSIDVTLKATVESELQKVLKGLNTIESKIIKSVKQKQETNLNQIRKIKDKFFPNGTLQERYENFAPYYLKYGKRFIPELKKVFDPFQFEIQLTEFTDRIKEID